MSVRLCLLASTHTHECGVACHVEMPRSFLAPQKFVTEIVRGSRYLRARAQPRRCAPPSMSGVAARLGWGQREAANGTDAASSSTLEAANEAAQQQERRATLAEAELREARHALRELALNLPVCERLVADLRADSAPSSPSVVVGAGAVGAALSGPREAELTQELEHVRLLLEHTRCAAR